MTNQEYLELTTSTKSLDKTEFLDLVNKLIEYHSEKAIKAKAHYDEEDAYYHLGAASVLGYFKDNINRIY